MMSWFATEFGFSPQEVVALMGIHTLGKASARNSGFEVNMFSFLYKKNWLHHGVLTNTDEGSST